MNHLTTLYVNQADRERKIAEDLRNREILRVIEPDTVEATRLATSGTRPATTNPRAAALRARTAGR